MVDAVVSFALQRLGALIDNETEKLSGVKSQIEQARNELVFMQSFLKDVDVSSRDGHRLLSKWISDVRAVSCNFEDTITTYVLASSGIVSKFNLFKARKLAIQVAEICNKLSELNSNFERYGLLEESKKVVNDLRQRRRTLCHTGDMSSDELVGIEKRSNEILAYLTSGDSSGRVAAICGMGGLGKTTIARKIYHDLQPETHFECFAWVYVSQQCQPVDVWQQLLLNLTSGSEKDYILKMGEDELTNRLRQALESKKCLIVLDDIWSGETWDQLKRAFPMKEMRGKILVTTRNKSVVSDPNAFLFEPQCLDDHESWELFEKKANLRKGQNEKKCQILQLR